MSSQTSNPPLPPIPPSSPTIGGTVRRHHTISASSRSARASARESISEEVADQPFSNEDEPVDEDWVGGVGAVGEKTSLHRQSSLPTKYHRAFGSRSGNRTPKTVNSLAAIAGHEGDEEPWNIGNYSVQDDDHPTTEQQAPLEAQTSSPLSPHFVSAAHEPSPPPAGSGVRRHVSLTYGAVTAGSRKAGLKRSGTLQTATPTHSQASASPPEPAEHSQEEEYNINAEEAGTYNSYDDDYFTRQQQANPYPASPPIGRSSPWTPNNEWRNPGYTGTNTSADDVQRALSALELSSNHTMTHPYHPGGQSIHPPRFNPPYPPPLHVMGSRHNSSGSNSSGNGKNQVVTDYDGRQTPLSQGRGSYMHSGNDRSSWDQKDHTLSNRTSNSNLQYGYQQGASQHGKSGLPTGAPQGQGQYMQHPRLSATSPFGQQQHLAPGQTQAPGFLTTPIDVPTLIATKGYNPIDFDTKPAFARYFVIKSYTEDDVHKSLKYEIWSSTDPGNKRLDKAFKEANGRGPVYLFFSVNASGHFCGMAEMLTPVDYTRSSTVWASDKWKGVFKVRWIFVRDIPNVNLRHIKLNNTQERKPVTNSRDTQELLPDAGQEMLRIFHTHPAKTSLLQDFAFYELQSLQKIQGQGGAPSSPVQANSAIHSPQMQAAVPQTMQQQNVFGMTNPPNPMAYQMAQMSPMLQMQLNMGMNMGMGMGSQYAIPSAQVMHQSVMRHPSPGPTQSSSQGFIATLNDGTRRRRERTVDLHPKSTTHIAGIRACSTFAQLFGYLAIIFGI
ncbi:hypothetical protein AX15_003162 [Amanita polypyramis BW_CC]|nr:hypothetical protein AX15_003162 [Amanita polypyramis BW_CC]